MGNIRLYLRANEKIFINGAVFRVDRKVSIELLNNTNFLLENHVMQKEDATTPLKQLYFVVQLLLMDPNNTNTTKILFRDMIANILKSLDNVELMEGIKEIDEEVSSGNIFAALKLIRTLFALELLILNQQSTIPEKQISEYEPVAQQKGM